jgi:hypothetical protein
MTKDNFHWNSQKIAEDLMKIPNVTKTSIEEPGGDFDTENILVEVLGGDTIFVSAYQYEHSNTLTNPDDVDVHYVSIEDGLDSRGGLNSRLENTAFVYFSVRQYFIKHNAVVINHYDEIF